MFGGFSFNGLTEKSPPAKTASGASPKIFAGSPLRAAAAKPAATATAVKAETPKQSSVDVLGEELPESEMEEEVAAAPGRKKPVAKGKGNAKAKGKARGDQETTGADATKGAAPAEASEQQPASASGTKGGAQEQAGDKTELEKLIHNKSSLLSRKKTLHVADPHNLDLKKQVDEMSAEVANLKLQKKNENPPAKPVGTKRPGAAIQGDGGTVQKKPNKKTRGDDEPEHKKLTGYLVCICVCTPCSMIRCMHSHSMQRFQCVQW